MVEMDCFYVNHENLYGYVHCKVTREMARDRSISVISVLSRVT